MAIFWALTVGLVIWLVLWALGIKAFDAFMPTVAMLSVAAIWRMARPYVLQSLGRD